MKTSLLAILGLILLVTCHSSPTSLAHQPTTNTKNASNNTNTSRDATTPKTQHAFTANDNNTFANEEALVIDLEEIQRMSVLEYARRRIRSMWDYLMHGTKTEPKSTFVGRCIGLAKKIKQLLPLVMIGGAVIIMKLAFLILFSLKTIGLVTLLLLLNVATVAAKLGALLSSKKSEHSPQNLHVHVQPWKNDEHIFPSAHHGGPPYGWDDKSDTGIETHELYNLYEKLKFENNLRRYLSSNTRV